MSRTTEEKFIIKSYESAPFEQFDCFQIGHELGLHDKAILNITKVLSRSNFIRKIDNSTIQLTENGRNLAQSLSKK